MPRTFGSLVCPLRGAALGVRLPCVSVRPTISARLMDSNVIRTEIKELIIRELNLEGKTPADIDDVAPLFGEGLGLDSLDALQLAMSIEEKYQVKLPEGDQVRPIFASIASLAEFVVRSHASP